MTASTLRVAAATSAVMLLLGSCAPGSARDDSPTQRSARSDSLGPHGPGPADSPDPALAGEPTPTLPSGEPGIDGALAGTNPVDGANRAEDSHNGGADDDRDEGADDGHAPVNTVPGAALLDTGTVAEVAGGTWTAEAGPAGCGSRTPSGALASRSATMTALDGRLVQRVSTYATVPASNVAVDTMAAALRECGFTPAGDPRLGTASAELNRTGGPSGGERAVVLAAEGVTVVLVASGSAAAPGAWESITDIALGTSCAAAVHGCH